MRLIQTVLIVLWALGGLLAIINAKGKAVQRTLAVIENLAVVFLVPLLTIYGFLTIFPGRFFSHLSWLDARVAQLDAWMLSWIFYSQSRPYELLTGFMEALCAVLLFFRRTRRLGALLITPFLVHLATWAREYQIGQTDAFPMLVASCFLVLLNLREYKKFFWDSGSATQRDPQPFGRRAHVTAIVFKYVLGIAVITITVFLATYVRGFRAKPELYGKWRVESVAVPQANAVKPLDFAPGSFFYFENSQIVCVRTEDLMHYGTYQLDLRQRRIELSVYDVHFDAYREISYSSQSVRQKYFQPNTLMYSLSGIYSRSGDGTLLLELTSQEGPLAIRLKPETSRLFESEH